MGLRIEGKLLYFPLEIGLCELILEKSLHLTTPAWLVAYSVTLGLTKPVSSEETKPKNSAVLSTDMGP